MPILVLVIVMVIIVIVVVRTGEVGQAAGGELVERSAAVHGRDGRDLVQLMMQSHTLTLTVACHSLRVTVWISRLRNQRPFHFLQTVSCAQVAAIEKGC